ncbi:MAG: DUF1931 domain-containing protein [Candidatus Rokuibacteriota bacterium]
MVINKTAVKEVTGDFRLSNRFYPALEAHVIELIERAKKRAESNGRTTLMSHDL